MKMKQQNSSWMKKIIEDKQKAAAEKKRQKFIQEKETVREKIIDQNSPFYVRESYKALRTNLIFSLPSGGCKTISVTSSGAGEGKSTNCANIAISFAEMNAKVLIIDCDLRRPNGARLLNIKNSPGLSNYLVGLNSVEEIVCDTAYENLKCIPAGDIPPNPVELLSSDHMEELVNKLKEEYDYIFLDTPPINLVIDNVVMTKYVDGVVVVVLQNSTDKEALKNTLSQLEFAHAKVLGFVLNGVTIGSKNIYKELKNKYSAYFAG